jgi:chain length determinant protein EpsF
MQMNLDRFLAVMRARWRLIAGVFVTIVFAVLVLSLIWPKQYKATASVIIDAKTDPIVGAMGGAYTDQLLASYVTTQAQVIASERVAQSVVKAMSLDRDPKMRQQWLSSTRGVGDISIWLADYLIDRRLSVTAGQESGTHVSNVIDIAVTWSDAATAATLANEFAQRAIETNIELKVEPAKQYAAWFQERTRTLRAELGVKQKRLSDFQNTAGIVATDEKLDVENTRLGELSTELVAIQSQRQGSLSRQRQASGDNASLPEVLQSPVIASLKKDLADAEGKQQDIAAQLGKNHPDYQAAKATVDSLHDRIQQETNKIVASLTSVSQVDARRENEIRQAVEDQKKRVMELKHQHDDAAVLENDTQAAQRDLDAVNQRLAQSNLESLTQQTNMVQLTFASPPIRPASPKITLNVALSVLVGGVLGIVAAILLELRNPRVRSGQELAELCGVPTLGSIPRTRPRGKDFKALPPAGLDPSVI